jgi:hypothetical protein
MLYEFVNSGQSRQPMPTQVVFQSYQPDPKLVKYKKELAARHHLQKDTDELDSDGRVMRTPE